jgi:riboflavin biosynthesis pyrimidine reductase
MAMTLDGQVVSPGKSMPEFSSRRDREHLFELRARNQIVLVGAGTVRAESLQPLVRSELWRAWRKKETGSEHPDVAVVSGSGHLNLLSSFFSDLQRFHLFSHHPAPRAVPDMCCWHIIPKPEKTVEYIVHHLHSSGYDRILVEGGPGLAHSFFKANVVDEIYLTLVGKVLGGGPLCGISQGPALLSDVQFGIRHVENRGEECLIHLVKGIRS